MNCLESARLLHAHADDELDASKSRALERHFETCSQCAAKNESLLSLKSAMRDARLRFDAPKSLRTEVRRIGRRSRGEVLRSFNPLLFWKTWALGATALTMALILLRPGISQQDTLVNEAVSSHVRSLMVGHLTDVPSSDQHTVKPWFNGKLDFAPDVSDFAAQGFPLIGGRLDYLNNRNVAALVYQRNRHFINVFVWPAAGRAAEQMTTKRLRGYSVIDREADGLHYCFVSDLNGKELAELASLFGN